MTSTKILALGLIALALSACKADYESHNYHSDSYVPPSLYAFNVLDSYAVNSEFDAETPRINPYINNGEFEVFWEVDSKQAHRTELFINDRPEPDYGILLSSAWCGRGENCGRSSYQYCHYQPELSINCDLPESAEQFGRRDVAELFTQIPESLFLVLEVCDNDLLYCEFRAKRVLFE